MNWDERLSGCLMKRKLGDGRSEIKKLVEDQLEDGEPIVSGFSGKSAPLPRSTGLFLFLVLFGTRSADRPLSPCGKSDV